VRKLVVADPAAESGEAKNRRRIWRLSVREASIMDIVADTEEEVVAVVVCEDAVMEVMANLVCVEEADIEVVAVMVRP
jgi:hypothetical protein